MTTLYTSSDAIDTNRWTHIAVVVDKVNEVVRFYKDNVLIDIKNAPGLNLVNNDNFLLIGKNPQNTFFSGILDDVRVYDNVLTKRDLQNIYNEKLDRNLILHYDFEKYDHAKGEVYDESIYGSDGLLINKETEAKDFTKEIGQYAVSGTAFNADVDQYIRIPTTAKHYVQGHNLDNCTMTAWVNTNKLNSFEPILHKDGVFSFGLDYGHAVLRLGDGTNLHPLPAITLMDTGMDNALYKSNFDQPARSLHFRPDGFAYNKYFSVFRSDHNVVDEEGLVTVPSGSAVPKTLAFWFKGVVEGPKYYAFSLRTRRDDGGTADQYFNRVISNRFYFVNDRYISTTVNLQNVMYDNQWHHHVIVYDINKSVEECAKYFLDGVEIGSGVNNTIGVTGSTNIGEYTDMGLQFNKILRGNGGNGLNQRGDENYNIDGTLMENDYLLCEFAYWNNKAMTNNDVKNIYKAKLGTLTTFDIVPNVYYSFASQDLGINKGTYHTEKYSLKGFNIQLSYDIPENRSLTTTHQQSVDNVSALSPPSSDNHLVSVDFNGGDLTKLQNTDFEFVEGYYDNSIAMKVNETQHIEIDGSAFENANMNTMSFGAWINPESVAGTQPILSRVGEENTILFSMVNDKLVFEIKNGKGPGMADITLQKKLEHSGTFSLEVHGYVSDSVSGNVYVVAIKNQYANTEQVLIDYVKANVTPIKSFEGGLVRTYFKSQPITTYLTTHTSAESNPILYDSDFFIMVVTIDVNNLHDVYYINNKDVHTSDYDPKLGISNATGLFDGEKLIMNFNVTSRYEIDVMVTVHNQPRQVPFNFIRLDTVSNVSNMSMSFEVTEANYTNTTKVSVHPLSRLYVYIELVNVVSGQRMSEYVVVDNVSVRDSAIPYVNVIKRDFNETKTSMNIDFTMYSATTRIVRYYVANFVSSTKQISNDSMYITIITNKDSDAVFTDEGSLISPFVVSTKNVTLTHGLSLESNSTVALAANHTVDTRILAIDEVGKFYLTNSYDSYLYYENMVYNSVHALGLNNYSQLGDGTTTNQTIEPLEVLGNYNIVKISTGYRYTMFVTSNNELYGMGYNNYGQIGTGNTTSVTSPVRVLPNQKVKDVVCGYDHTVILTVNGKVFVTGHNGEGRLGTNSTSTIYVPVQTMASHVVKFIATSYQNSYFVTEDNRAFVCGRGSEGQIGDGANSQRNYPVEVTIPGERIIEVYATKANNSITTYYRTLRNELYSTGYNGHGQIGNKSTSNINTPFKIPMAMPVKRVATSDYNVVIMDVNNRVFVLGYNGNYQLATGNTTNVIELTEVVQHLNVRRIECGYRNTYFMTVTNELYAVGRNTYGELGTGNTTQLNTVTLVQPVGVSNIVAVESSAYPDSHHTFFFTGIAPETTINATEVSIENGTIVLRGSLSSGANNNVEYFVLARTVDANQMDDAAVESFVAEHESDTELVHKGLIASVYNVVDLKTVRLAKAVDAVDNVVDVRSVNFVSVMLYMKLENGNVVKQVISVEGVTEPNLVVTRITYDGLSTNYQIEGSLFMATDSVSSYYLAGFDLPTTAVVTDDDMEAFAITNQGDAPVVKVTQTVAQGAVFAFSTGVPALFADINDNTALTPSEQIGTNIDVRIIVTLASDSSTFMSKRPIGAFVSVRDVDWSQETANTPDYDLSKTDTTNGNYGISSAISHRGNTALVTGHFNNSTRGGGWIWTYDETTDEYKITGDLSINGTTYGEYGRSCSLSGDGKIAVIAGYYNTSQGGVFVWTLDEDSNTWSMTQDLSKTSGAGGYYGMACACDASADTLLITGYNNQSSGCAYVFHRDKESGLWSQTANLSKTSGVVGYYGHACALSADGKTALISGYYDTTKGSAFVFTYNESTGSWTETADLSKPSGTNGRYGFQCDLSADGKTALITGYNTTTSGGAFVWTTGDGKTWSETADLSMTSGTKGYYGHSCSLSADGTTALVVGYTNTSSGGAWLWTYDGSSWIAAPYDLSKNASTNGNYGTFCAMSADGSTVLVVGHASTSSGGAWIWRGIDNGEKTKAIYDPAPEIPFVVENNAESLLNPHIHDVYYDESINAFVLYGSLHSALDNATNNVYAMAFVPELSGNKRDFAVANGNTLLKKVVSVQKNNVEFFTFEMPLSAYDNLDDVTSTTPLGIFDAAEFRLVATNGSVVTLGDAEHTGVGENAVAMYGVNWDGVATAFQTISTMTWSDISGDGMRMVTTKNVSINTGNMHIYEYNETTGQYDEVYTHTMTSTNGYYGNRCHISTDGNSILVTGHLNIYQGCAFVWQYDHKTKAWGRFNADGSHTAEDPHDLSLYTNQVTQYGMESAISGDGKTVCIGGYYNNYHGEIYVMHYDEVSARWGKFSGGSFSTSYDTSTDRYNIRNSAHYHRDNTGYVSGHVQMGRSMDLSGDGSVMVFGMYRNDIEHISSTTNNRIYVHHYNKKTGEWGRFDPNGGFTNKPHMYNRFSTSDTGRYGQHVAVSANGKVIVVSGENSTSGRSWIYHYSDEHAAWGKFLPDGTFAEGEGHIYAASSNGNYPQRGALSADGRIAYFYSSGSSQGGIFVWQYNDATHNWGHYAVDESFVSDTFTRVAGEFTHMSVSPNGLFAAGMVSSNISFYKANHVGVVSVVNLGESFSNKAIYLSTVNGVFDNGTLKVEVELVRPKHATVDLKVFATTHKQLSESDALNMNNDSFTKRVKESFNTTIEFELDHVVDVNGTVVPANNVSNVDLYVIVNSASNNVVVPKNLFKKAVSLFETSTTTDPYVTVTAVYERADNTVAVQGAAGSVHGTIDKLYMVAFESRSTFDTVVSPADMIVATYEAGDSQVIYQTTSIARYAVQKAEFTLTHVYKDAEMTTVEPISVDRLDRYDIRVMAIDSTNSTNYISRPFVDMKAVVYPNVYAIGRNDYYQLGNFYNNTNMNNAKRVLKGYNVVDISMGNLFGAFVTSEGFAYGFGYNNYSQLGTGNTTNYYYHPYKIMSDVKNVECGHDFTTLIKRNGDVYTMGYNGYGQLATANTSTQTTPKHVMSDVVEISCGDYHVLFLKKDGTLFVCGYNGNGQLGTGNTTNISTPVQVTTSAAVKRVFGGYRSSFYITVDDEVFGFGLNSEGQLGLGDNTQRTSPVSLATTLPTDKVVYKISQGIGHTIFLMTDGTVYTTGRYNEGQLGLGTLSAYKSTPELVLSLTKQVVDIAAYKYGSYFVDNTGTAYSTGQNNYSQLGDGTTTQRTTVAQVIFADTRVKVNGVFSNETCDFGLFVARHSEASISFTNADFVRAKPEVCVDVKAMGTPMTWYVVGVTSKEVPTLSSIKQTILLSDANVLVQKHTLDSYQMKHARIRLDRVMTPNGPAPAYAVNFVRMYAYAVDRAGNELYTTTDIVYQDMVDKPHGVLTNREKQATGVMIEAIGFSSSNNVVEIIVAGFSSRLTSSKMAKARNMMIANKETNGVQLSVFGSTNRGNIVTTPPNLFTKVFNGDLRGGFVDITEETSDLDFRVITIDDVGNAVISEAFYIPYVQDVRRYYESAGVGSNSYGQLATFSGRGNIKTLRKTANMRQVAKGYMHTVYIDDSGSLYGVGYNNYGQLGTGNTTTQYTPVSISVSNVKKVACGYDFSMFLTHDGELYGCGRNNNGQLGLGHTSDRSSPEKAMTDLKMIDIACGQYYTIAITENHDVFATGNNGNYQLGTGNNTSRNMFTQIDFNEKVKEVHCALTSTIFITMDNRVFAAGTNGSGEFGTGDTSQKNTITEIMGGKNVIQLSMGDYHTGIVTSDLKVYMCGRNNEGQIGDGTTSNKSTPTQVMTRHDVISVHCGYRRTYFRTTTGKIFATGYNNEGQLGLNDTTNRSVPEEMLLSDNIYNVVLSNHQNHGIFHRAYVGFTRVDIERADQDSLGLLVDMKARSERSSKLHVFVSENDALTKENINSIVSIGKGVKTYHLYNNFITSVNDLRLDSIISNTGVPVDIGQTVTNGAVYACVTEDEPRNASYSPSHTVSITVTLDDNAKYVFDPAISQLETGNVYLFDNTSAGSAHPLRFTSSASHPGMENDDILFRNDDTHIITVSFPADTTVTTIYAHCGLHQNMGSEVNPIGVITNVPSPNTVGITVTVNQSMKYTFNPPVEEIKAGDVYVFDNTSAGSSHPLRFTSSATHPGVENDSILFKNDDTHIITVTLSKSTSISALYAHCALHQNMGSEVNPIPVVLPTTSDADTSSQKFVFKRSVALKESNKLPVIPYQGVFKEVYAVGYNGYYHLGTGDNSGNGTNTNQNIPVPVYTDYSIADMRINYFNSAFITDEGKVYTDGHNNYGQLGNGNTTSYKLSQVMTSHRVKQVELSYAHTAFVTEDGKAFVCGRNDEGYKRLCTGDSTNYSTPVQVINSYKIKQVAIGYQHTMFLTEEGEVFGGGRNDIGMVGNNTMGNTDGRILRTMLPENMKVTQIECSKYSTFFLMMDGSVYATGYNNNGEVGVGSTSQVKVPEKMQGLSGQRVVKISAGLYIILALTEFGQVYGCGQNNYGQLGTNPSESNRFTTFTPIDTNNRKVIDVTAAGYSSFFVTDEYEAYGFGYNNYGQLGDHSKFNRFEPYQVRCDGKKIGKVFGGMYDTHSAFFGIVDPDQKMSVEGLQIDRNIEDEVLDVSAKVEAPFDAPATLRVVGTIRLDTMESEAKSLADANKGSRAVLTVPLLAGTSKTIKLPLTHVIDESGDVVRSATAGAVRVFVFVDRDGTTDSVVKSEVFAIPSTPALAISRSSTNWRISLAGTPASVDSNRVWYGTNGSGAPYDDSHGYYVIEPLRIRTDIISDLSSYMYVPDSIALDNISNFVINKGGTGVFKGTNIPSTHSSILYTDPGDTYVFLNGGLTVDDYTYVMTLDIEFTQKTEINEFIWAGNVDRAAMPHMLMIEYSDDGVNYETDVTYYRGFGTGAYTGSKHPVLNQFDGAGHHMIIQRKDNKWQDSVSKQFRQ